MNFKFIFCSLFLIPLFLNATSLETQIGDLLGQSYKSEAAQSFFKAHQLGTDFPERYAFTHNFYKQGVSVKINGGEFIQAIQVYNETMFFKAFTQEVYGKKLTEVYGDNDIYKVIKMAPISEDKASGIFIYPNKKPADYLVRVVRKSDNTMRAIAWMLDENAIAKIIAEATKPTHDTGINSHDAIWTLLGTNFDTEARNKFIEGSFASFNENYGDPIFDKDYGIYIRRGFLYKPRREIIEFIEFKRQGQFGTKVSFPHALPEGLFWWSTPDDFAKVLNLKASKSEVGVYVFEKQTEAGTMSAVFSMGILSYVRFNAKKEK